MAFKVPTAERQIDRRQGSIPKFPGLNLHNPQAWGANGTGLGDLAEGIGKVGEGVQKATGYFMKRKERQDKALNAQLLNDFKNAKQDFLYSTEDIDVTINGIAHQTKKGVMHREEGFAKGTSAEYSKWYQQKLSETLNRSNRQEELFYDLEGINQHTSPKVGMHEVSQGELEIENAHKVIVGRNIKEGGSVLTPKELGHSLNETTKAQTNLDPTQVDTVVNKVIDQALSGSLLRDASGASANFLLDSVKERIGAKEFLSKKEFIDKNVKSMAKKEKEKTYRTQAANGAQVLIDISTNKTDSLLALKQVQEDGVKGLLSESFVKDYTKSAYNTITKYDKEGEDEAFIDSATKILSDTDPERMMKNITDILGIDGKSTEKGRRKVQLLAQVAQKLGNDATEREKAQLIFNPAMQYALDAGIANKEDLVLDSLDMALKSFPPEEALAQIKKNEVFRQSMTNEKEEVAIAGVVEAYLYDQNVEEPLYQYLMKGGVEKDEASRISQEIAATQSEATGPFDLLKTIDMAIPTLRSSLSAESKDELKKYTMGDAIKDFATGGVAGVAGGVVGTETESYNPKGTMSALLNTASMLPENMKAATYSIYEDFGQGASVVNRSKKNQYIKDVNDKNEKLANKLYLEYGQKKALPGIPITIQDVQELSQNLANSLTNIGAATMSALPSILTPDVVSKGVAFVLGTTGAYQAAYHMSHFQFLQGALEAKNNEKIAKTGEGLTQKEEDDIKAKYEKEAKEYARWEAGTEAASTMLTLSVFTAPFAKIVEKTVGKGLAKKVIGGVSSMLITELGGETLTEKKQTPLLHKSGQSDIADVSWWQAMKNVAPQTFMLTLAMGGAGVIAKTAMGHIKKSLKAEVKDKTKGQQIFDKVYEGVDQDKALGPQIDEQAAIDNQETIDAANEAVNDLTTAEVEQKKAEEILKRNGIKDTVVKIVDQIMGTDGDSKAGSAKSGEINISKDKARSTTGYHEAFHRVSKETFSATEETTVNEEFGGREGAAEAFAEYANTRDASNMSKEAKTAFDKMLKHVMSQVSSEEGKKAFGKDEQKGEKKEQSIQDIVDSKEEFQADKVQPINNIDPNRDVPKNVQTNKKTADNAVDEDSGKQGPDTVEISPEARAKQPSAFATAEEYVASKLGVDKIMPKDEWHKMKDNIVPKSAGKGQFMIVGKTVNISDIDVTGKTLDVARNDISEFGERSYDTSNILVRASEDGTIALVDGRHRLVEAIDRGEKTIKVDVHLPLEQASQLTKEWQDAQDNKTEFQLSERYRKDVEERAEKNTPEGKVLKEALRWQKVLDDMRASGVPLRSFNPDKAWVENNMDYIKSIDPDLLCQRSEGCDIAVNHLKTLLGDRTKKSKYTAGMAWEVLARAASKGLKIACPQCYLFGNRKKGKGANQKKFIVGIGGYDGNLLRLGDTTTSTLQERGLRHYSSTDFKAEHIPGLIAEVVDAQKRSVPVVGYTKEAGFVEIFAPAGAYTLMSVGRSDVVGMDMKVAKKLRKKHRTAATVYVAFNDAEIMKALRDPEIDHVIPWHASGIKKAEIRDLLGDESIQDYTSVQMERESTTTTKAGKELKKAKLVNSADKIKDSEHNGSLEKYLELVEERGVVKKFDAIYDALGEDEKAVYMKLIGPEYGKFSEEVTVEGDNGKMFAPPDATKIDTKAIKKVMDERASTVEDNFDAYKQIAEDIAKEVKSGTYVEGEVDINIGAMPIEPEIADTVEEMDSPEYQAENAGDPDDIRDNLNKSEMRIRPESAKGKPETKRDIEREVSETIKKQGEKISDEDMRRQREENLLGKETIDEIVARKRGIITDQEAVDRASRMKGTIDDVLNIPKGSVPNKEQLTAIGQIVQQEREINQKIRDLIDAESGMDERSDEVLQDALEQSTLKLRKAEIVLFAAKSEAGRALQGAKQALAAVDSRLRIALNKIKKLPLGKRAAITEILATIHLDDNKAFIKLLDDLNTADFFDKFAEWATAIKLYNPTTHIVNLGSNTVRQLVDAGITTITSPKYAKADMQGALVGLMHGVKNALRAMTDEGYASTLSKYIEEGGAAPAIGGAFGKWLRTSFRALGASDEIFKAVAYQRSLYRQAARKANNDPAKMKELLERPTLDMMEEATEIAKRMTFQEDMGEISKAVNKFRTPSNFKNPVAKAASLLTRIFVPFLKTPVNLAKQAVDLSPLGLVKNQKELRDAIKNKNDEKVKTIVGEAAFGTLVMAAVAALVADDRITGGAPRKSADRDQFYRENKLPYAIKIGDKWYQYKRVDPVSTVVGITADAIALSKEEDFNVGGIIDLVSQNLEDKTFLRGLNDLMKIFSGEPWERERAIKSAIIGVAIPSLVGHVARTVDPTIRATDGIVDRAKSQIPFVSKTLPARVNVFGNEIERANKGLNYFFNPIQSETAEIDPVTKHLTDIGYSVPLPGSYFTRNKVKHELSTAEYHDYSKYVGERVAESIAYNIGSMSYENSSIDEKIKTIKKERTAIINEWKDAYLEGKEVASGNKQKRRKTSTIKPRKRNNR